MNPETIMEEVLYKLKVGESTNISESNWSSAFRITWHVVRVPNGWIFIEDNASITRMPVNVFVPLTTYTNPNV